jgi:hypothetical protein
MYYYYYYFHFVYVQCVISELSRDSAREKNEKGGKRGYLAKVRCRKTPGVW